MRLIHYFLSNLKIYIENHEVNEKKDINTFRKTAAVSWLSSIFSKIIKRSHIVNILVTHISVGCVKKKKN